MEHNVSLGCVVMAAGNARRFGANKLAAPLGGRSLFCAAWKRSRPSSLNVW